MSMFSLTRRAAADPDWLAGLEAIDDGFRKKLEVAGLGEPLIWAGMGDKLGFSSTFLNLKSQRTFLQLNCLFLFNVNFPGNSPI